LECYYNYNDTNANSLTHSLTHCYNETLLRPHQHQQQLEQRRAHTALTTTAATMAPTTHALFAYSRTTTQQ